MRLILGAIVGSVIVFIVSAVLHMATPLGMMGIGMIPNEDAVTQAIRANVTANGLYMFPGWDAKSMTKEQEEAWTQKLRGGPYGLLVVHLQGSEPMSPRQLVLELLSVFAAALVAGFLLLLCGGPYGIRALLPALLALFAFFSVTVSQWIWYTFPLPFILGMLAIEILGWLLAGFAMAKIIRARVVVA